jgi:phosphatidylglycerophosphatase A
LGRADLHLAIATALGAGRAPFAPGTAGAAVGLALAFLLVLAGGPVAVLVGALVVTVLGFVCAGPAARALGESDPGPVVIDEVAGQMIAVAFVPLTIPYWIGAFFLFRVLDVTKPYPAGRLEALPGGSGIMADDLAAGLYANGAMQVVRWIVSGHGS